MNAVPYLPLEVAPLDKQAQKFLQKLVEAHGTSGYEQNVQRLFREYVEPLSASVTTDVMGSVVAALNPQGSPRLLLDGHADEIGFLVRYIDDKGFLYVARVGGWDPEIVVGQRVLVHTASGPVPGVFGKKAAHLIEEDEKKKKSDLDKMWIDIGAASGDEARELVAVGDFVTMNATYVALRNGRAAAKSFDNRVGIFVVAETLRRLQGRRLAAAVYGVSAVQEEIGLRGARTAAYGIDPVVGIAVDVCHTADYPDSDRRKVGDLALGRGPVLCRGPNINPRVFERLVEVARDQGLPYQVEAAGGGTGTDANAIQLTRSGVATGLVSIPLRYMHSPCEVLALEDVENTSKLLAAFAESLTPEDRWAPS